MIDNKHIQIKELRKVISMYSNMFPCDLGRIDIFNIDNNISMCFFDKNKNDVSWKFASKKFDDKNCLMDVILSDISKINKVKATIENGEVLSYKIKDFSKKIMYLNPDSFRIIRVKNGYTMMGLADTIDIGYNTLQTLENQFPIDHSISHIVKYSLFFKENILNFFDKKLSKELTKIMLVEYHVKGYIDKDTLEHILKNEF